jgi:uncharacterized OB-fold protein
MPVVQENDIFIFKEKLQVPFIYSAGPVVSRFYQEIRENKRIMALRCDSCKRVIMPPRAICGRCFCKLTEWVEVGKEGKVMSFTTVHYSEPIHPLRAPFHYGLILLDGSDTPFIHLIGEADERDLHIGMRVEAIFSEQPKGNILDIKYFRPLR